MEKREFQAESKRMMELMIHSIYTHKDIFIRELISNASDAIDKIYYEALTNEELTFQKENYYIEIVPDKENRQLTIKDTGIGMNQEELENNLRRLCAQKRIGARKRLKRGRFPSFNF